MWEVKKIGEGKYNWINSDDYLMTDEEFLYCGKFTDDNLAVVQIDKDIYNWMDIYGDFFDDNDYLMTYDFKDGYAVFQNYDKSYGLIDKAGNIIIDGLISCTNFVNGYLIAEIEPDVFIWIDEYLNEIGTGYLKCGNFNNGFAIFQDHNGLYGWVDTLGNEVMNGLIETYDFNYNMGIGRDSKGYYLFNTIFEKLNPIAFNSYEIAKELIPSYIPLFYESKDKRFEYIYEYNNNHAIFINYDGSYGIINSAGDIIIDKKMKCWQMIENGFKDIDSDLGGYGIAKFQDFPLEGKLSKRGKGLYGWVDTRGNIIMDTLKEATEFIDRKADFKTINGHIGTIDIANKIYWKNK